MSTEHALRRIRAYAAHRRLAKSRLAVEAGLSRNALMGMDRSDWSPTVKTVRKIEAIIPPEFTPDPKNQITPKRMGSHVEKV